MRSFEKSYGCLIGLAIGDAMGAPTEGKTREEIFNLYGEITDFVSEEVSGTDDTEYAMLTAHILIENQGNITAETVAKGWKKYILEQKEPLRKGGEAARITVENLKRGIMPPLSGMANTGRWSDGAAMRISPIGIYCAGDPQKAAKLAQIDAQISHAYDGIYCAQAMAASVSVAMNDGSSVENIIQAGLKVIPDGTWSKIWIEKGLKIASKYTRTKDALDELSTELNVGRASAAPEAVSEAYAIFKLSKGNFQECVLSGANLGRDADTVAAMAGALSGALQGIEKIPSEWIEKVRFTKGICIKSMGGMDIEEIARKLVSLSPSRSD